LFQSVTHHGCRTQTDGTKPRGQRKREREERRNGERVVGEKEGGETEERRDGRRRKGGTEDGKRGGRKGRKVGEEDEREEAAAEHLSLRVLDGGLAVAARVAAANAEAARKAKEQQELREILALIPSIGELTLSLGETTQSLYSTKCVKGKTTKYVKSGAKCPKGYVKKK
jgi:hypothetical protein